MKNLLWILLLMSLCINAIQQHVISERDSSLRRAIVAGNRAVAVGKALYKIVLECRDDTHCVREVK